ncbi:MAG TPA: hypothetical protein VGC04_12045 [Cellulomonas sp.]
MSAQPVEVARPPAGRTTIRAQALRTLVKAVVADAAGVPSGRASVTLEDHGGSLAVTATVPAVLDPGSPAMPSLVDRAAAIRQEVADELMRLVGRTARPVDVRFSGIHRVAVRRVA